MNPNREALPLGACGPGFFSLPTLRVLLPLPSAGGKSTLFISSDSGQSSRRPFKIQFLNSTGYFGNSETGGCVALSVSVICSAGKAHILELASVLAFCKWNMNAFILRKKQKKNNYKNSGIIRIKSCKVGRFLLGFFSFLFSDCSEMSRCYNVCSSRLRQNIHFWTMWWEAARLTLSWVVPHCLYW